VSKIPPSPNERPRFPWFGRPSLEQWRKTELARYRNSGGDEFWRWRDALGPEDWVVALGPLTDADGGDLLRRFACKVLSFKPDAGPFPLGLTGTMAPRPGLTGEASGQSGGAESGPQGRKFSDVLSRLNVGRIGLVRWVAGHGADAVLLALEKEFCLPKVASVQIDWAAACFSPALRRRIDGVLARTHRLQWRFDSVIESWILKEPPALGQGDAVEVVIPAYNAERYIAQAIASVLAQTRRPAGLIVVDDGSGDGTAAVVEACARASRDVPIRLLRQPNRGPNAARNAGLALSQAAFIAFLDADDFWDPAKLESQMALMLRSPEVGLVYCDQKDVDAEGRPRAGTFRFDAAVRGFCALKFLAENKVTGSASGVLLRRSILRESGWFEESLRYGEDWEAWGRLARSTHLDYVRAKLVTIRRHCASNMTAHEGQELPADLRIMGILADAQPVAGRLRARGYAIWRLSVLPLGEARRLAFESPPALFLGFRWALSWPVLASLIVARKVWKRTLKLFFVRSRVGA